MSRLLSTFDLSYSDQLKLKERGFLYVRDLEGVLPEYLATVLGCSLEDTINFVDAVKRKPKLCVINALDALEQTFKNKKKQKITTSCKALDKIVGEGFPLGRVIEVYGDAGCGKTQLCMQLCCNVQIPAEKGGVGGEAVYVYSEDCLRTIRLESMARAVCESNFVETFTPESVMDHVYVFECATPEQLEICLIYYLEKFVENHQNVKLIVIDSISYQVRYGYENDFHQRRILLTRIADALHRLAATRQICVVIVNQITFNVEKQEAVAALGKAWAHSTSTKIELQRFQGTRRAIIKKSLLKKSGEALYAITNEGIRDVPKERS